MSIRVDWGDSAQTLIHLQFERGWKWQDLRASIQQADTLIGSVPHTVHLLIDIRRAGGVPADFITAAGDIFASGSARANEGQRVVIGAGPLIRLAYTSLTSVYAHKLKNRPFLFAGSLEEARALLDGRAGPET